MLSMSYCCEQTEVKQIHKRMIVVIIFNTGVSINEGYIAR